jgi:UPF0716 protein FxsA
VAIYIFLALVLVPLVEIGVFIELGDWLGLWPTLGFVVLTAIIGAALLRHQGLKTLARAQASLRDNRLPLREIFDAFCLFAAGLLLLTPGFVTDALGGLLLIPIVRTWLRLILARRVYNTQEGLPDDTHGPVIDGEYRHIPPENDRDGRPN